MEIFKKSFICHLNGKPCNRLDVRAFPSNSYSGAAGSYRRLLSNPHCGSGQPTGEGKDRFYTILNTCAIAENKLETIAEKQELSKTSITSSDIYSATLLENGTPRYTIKDGKIVEL